MEETHLTIYLIALASITLIISYLMEVYKRDFRKGKASLKENTLVAWILSAAGVFFLYFSNIIRPIFGVIGAPLWVDYITYAIIFYVAQFELSMKVIKRITKRFIINFLEDKGFSEEDINDLTK